MNKRWGVVKIKGYWYAFEDSKFLGLFWTRTWLDNMLKGTTHYLFLSGQYEGRHYSRRDAESTVAHRKFYLEEKEKRMKDNSEEYIL